MSISFYGIGEFAVTFLAADDVQANQPVKLSANGTVAACDENDRFFGVACRVSADGHALVQTGGFVTLPYTGTAPTLGYCALAADGAGGVTKGTSGEFLVVDIDTTAKTVGFFM